MQSFIEEKQNSVSFVFAFAAVFLLFLFTFKDIAFNFCLLLFVPLFSMLDKNNNLDFFGEIAITANLFERWRVRNELKKIKHELMYDERDDECFCDCCWTLV